MGFDRINGERAIRTAEQFTSLEAVDALEAESLCCKLDPGSEWIDILSPRALKWPTGRAPGIRILLIGAVSNVDRTSVVDTLLVERQEIVKFVAVITNGFGPFLESASVGSCRCQYCTERLSLGELPLVVQIVSPGGASKGLATSVMQASVIDALERLGHEAPIDERIDVGRIGAGEEGGIARDDTDIAIVLFVVAASFNDCDASRTIFS